MASVFRPPGSCSVVVIELGLGRNVLGRALGLGADLVLVTVLGPSGVPLAASRQ
jgi:hypothetical protein